MKPIAKKALLIVGVVYAIAVVLMVAALVRKGKPEHGPEVTRRIQQDLNAVQQWAYEAEPDYFRDRGLSESEANAILEQFMAAKGDIVGINYTLVLQILNFGVLLLLLYGLLWDPLLRILDQRRNAIRGSMDDAETDRQQAAGLLEQRHRELGELRSERTNILEQAESLGEQERREIVARARQEAQRIMEQTEERLSEETRRAREALRDEVAELATRIAAEVLKREISPEDHRQVVREMMEAMAVARAPGESEEEGP